MERNIRTVRELFEWAEQNGLADCPIGLKFQDEDYQYDGDTFDTIFWSREPDTKVATASKETKNYSDYHKNGNFKKTEHIDYVLLS